MQVPVCPELTTASVVRVTTTAADGQLCTIPNPPLGTYLSGSFCSNIPSHFCPNQKIRNGMNASLFSGTPTTIPKKNPKAEALGVLRVLLIGIHVPLVALRFGLCAALNAQTRGNGWSKLRHNTGGKPPPRFQMMFVFNQTPPQFPGRFSSKPLSCTYPTCSVSPSHFSDARTVLSQMESWFTDYNAVHPHKGSR